MKTTRKIRHISLLAGVFFLAMFSLHAEGYIPSTQWPYWYDEFQEGTVFFSGDQKSKQELLNIHLLHGTLHYLEGDRIKQSDPRGIEKIVIAADTFLYMEGELVQLIQEKNGSCLVKQIRIDKECLTANQTGAYGMGASSSAVQQLTSIQLDGISNLSYTQMKLEKPKGKELKLIETYYLIRTGQPVRVTRKDLEKSLPTADRIAFKAFVKQHKIKWKEETSLLQLLDFFDK